MNAPATVENIDSLTQNYEFIKKLDSITCFGFTDFKYLKSSASQEFDTLEMYSLRYMDTTSLQNHNPQLNKTIQKLSCKNIEDLDLKFVRESIFPKLKSIEIDDMSIHKLKQIAYSSSGKRLDMVSITFSEVFNANSIDLKHVMKISDTVQKVARKVYFPNVDELTMNPGLLSADQAVVTHNSKTFDLIPLKDIADSWTKKLLGGTLRRHDKVPNFEFEFEINLNEVNYQ